MRRGRVARPASGRHVPVSPRPPPRPADPAVRRRRRTPHIRRPPSCDATAASTSCGNTVSPPVLIASSTRPRTVSTPESSTAPTSSVRNQPGSTNGSGSTGLRYPLASVAPPSTTRPSSMRTSTPSSGTPVVHAAARGLAHPVRPDHRNACGRGPFGDAGRHRPAADQHGVHRRQRGRSGRVAQRLVELRGHQRDVPTSRNPGSRRLKPAPPQRNSRRSPRVSPRDARCAPAPAGRPRDGRAGRAATARHRRGGRASPTRWPSTPTPSAVAPFGVPVVPEVDTTTATSSSISEPARNDVASKEVSRSSSIGTGNTVARPASTSSTTGSTDSAEAPDGTATGRRTAMRPPPGRAGRRVASPSRPAVARTRSTSSGVGSSSVIWVISTPMSASSNSPRSFSSLTTAFTSSSVSRGLSSANSGTRSGPGTPSG